MHRVGRTARADSTGVALTLISDNDMDKFAQIEKLIEREIIKLPLPGNLGEGPEWNPLRSRRNSARRNFKSRSKGNSNQTPQKKQPGKKLFRKNPDSNK